MAGVEEKNAGREFYLLINFRGRTFDSCSRINTTTFETFASSFKKFQEEVEIRTDVFIELQRFIYAGKQLGADEATLTLFRENDYLGVIHLSAQVIPPIVMESYLELNFEQLPPVVQAVMGPKLLNLDDKKERNEGVVEQELGWLGVEEQESASLLDAKWGGLSRSASAASDNATAAASLSRPPLLSGGSSSSLTSSVEQNTRLVPKIGVILLGILALIAILFAFKPLLPLITGIAVLTAPAVVTGVIVGLLAIIALIALFSIHRSWGGAVFKNPSILSRLLVGFALSILIGAYFAFNSLLPLIAAASVALGPAVITGVIIGLMVLAVLALLLGIRQLFKDSPPVLAPVCPPAPAATTTNSFARPPLPSDASSLSLASSSEEKKLPQEQKAVLCSRQTPDQVWKDLKLRGDQKTMGDLLIDTHRCLSAELNQPLRLALEEWRGRETKSYDQGFMARFARCLDLNNKESFTNILYCDMVVYFLPKDPLNYYSKGLLVSSPYHRVRAA